jgi:hypothetical protein
LQESLDPNLILFNSLDTADPKGKLSFEEWVVEIKKAKPDVNDELVQ